MSARACRASRYFIPPVLVALSVWSVYSSVAVGYALPPWGVAIGWVISAISFTPLLWWFVVGSWRGARSAGQGKAGARAVVAPNDDGDATGQAGGAPGLAPSSKPKSGLPPEHFSQRPLDGAAPPGYKESVLDIVRA